MQDGRGEAVIGAVGESYILDISRMTMHNGPGIRTVVYFKGCPLRCLWCSTPESQNTYQEIGIFQSKCIQCGKCEQVCPQKGLTLDAGEVHIPRALCVKCGTCAASCNADALRVLGRSMTVDEVLTEVKKDKIFYQHSGGGVNLSGGEPLMHIDFAEKLMRCLHADGIRVGVDTSGYAPWEHIERILPYTAFFLWDIKHMDPIVHKKLTGVSNELILANARAIAARDIPIYLRLPMITGYNDSEENIRQVCAFAQTLPSLVEIDLIPLHHLGTARYQSLDRPYPLPEDLLSVSAEYMQHIRQIVASYGLPCSVVG